MPVPQSWVLDLDGLDRLLAVLRGRGYRVVGPVVRDGAIVHREVGSVSDLTRGVTSEQAAGSYRLRGRDDDLVFAHAAGAESWKRWFLPAREILTRGSAGTAGGTADSVLPEDPPVALIGVRACDLAAIAVHDRVLLSRGFVDERYRVRRRGAFVVAVTCAEPAGTCFCVSMGGGPRPGEGHDLALTELLDGGHRFLVDVGSEAGADVLAETGAELAPVSDVDAADRIAADAAVRMGRQLDTADVRELLYENAESPHWDDVAARCLACANCTLMCPTCFCTGIEDHVDLAGSTVERWRVWDSCFGSELTYLHGGSVRSSVGSRYRQWVTHKFASWVDQFGSSGCVGCGRCITWCPVGIDVTDEVAALRESETARRTAREATRARSRRTTPED